MQQQRPNIHNNSQRQQPDPFGRSFQDSAIQHFPYRIILIIFALLLLQLGKTSLPEDAVACIQDQVHDAIQPLTDFYIKNQGLGLTLMTIMQLVCDIQLVGMVIYWVVLGDSFRYPLAVGFLGISKILINILFKTRLIQKAFTKRLFLSLMFGQNFQNTYFFSGITALLVLNLLQFRERKYHKLITMQIVILVLVIFLLITMKLNWFMDVITAMAFAFVVFMFISQRSNYFDSFLLNPIQSVKSWCAKKQQSTQKRSSQAQT